jgi:hypothetical protein
VVDTKKIENELKKIMKAEREANEELKKVWFWQQGAVQSKLDGIYAERGRVKTKYRIKTVESDGISFTLYDGTHHKAGQKRKTKAQKKEDKQMVDAWNSLQKRMSGKSSTFQVGDKIRVCLGTLDNPCRKMRPGNVWGCPDECGGASFVDRTYEGEEWAKKNGYK